VFALVAEADPRKFVSVWMTASADPRSASVTVYVPPVAPESVVDERSHCHVVVDAGATSTGAGMAVRRSETYTAILAYSYRGHTSDDRRVEPGLPGDPRLSAGDRVGWEVRPEAVDEAVELAVEGDCPARARAYAERLG